MTKAADAQIRRFGVWSWRFLVLFLALGVVYANSSPKRHVRNTIVLLAIASGLGIIRTFWIRHLWHRQGFDPDADEIAEDREEAADAN